MKIASDWHIHTHNSCDEACMLIPTLIQQAKEKGNYTYGIYPPLKQSEIEELKEAYFKGWYKILKELALRGLKQ